MARRVCCRTRKWDDVDSGFVRSRAESLLSRYRQSGSGNRRSEPQGRQSFHVFDRGAESRYRQNGLVFSGFAARYARLGRDRIASPDRWHDRREATQAACASEPQWLLLSFGSYERQKHSYDAADRFAELGKGNQFLGRSDPRSGEVSGAEWRSCIAADWRCDELASSEL